MLILTRNVGERVFVGRDLIIKVIGVVNNQVRLGFQAPIELEIHREEVRVRQLLDEATKRGAGPCYVEQRYDEWGEK